MVEHGYDGFHMPNQRNYAILSNELLAQFYQRSWQFWLNRDSFCQAFVGERRRQWNIEKQLNKLENRMSIMTSNNPAVIDSILLKNDYVLK